MKTIRSIILAIVVVFGLVLPMSAVVTVLSATPAAACDLAYNPDCYRSSSGVSFSGDLILAKPIKVRVCNPYYDQLDVGTYKGVPARWWGPVMRFVSSRYGEWYGDLNIVLEPCKDYEVRPGTELRYFASCIDALITTGRMTRPGTYYMEPR